MECETCSNEPNQPVETYAVGYHHESPNQAVGKNLCYFCAQEEHEEMKHDNGFVIPLSELQ